MAKVIFTTTYEVLPAARGAYLSLAEEMKNYFQNTQNKDFNIYELRGKKNVFSEVFVCQNEEEYEVLEDTMDDEWQRLLQRLQAYMIEGKTQYSVLVETGQ